METKKERKTFEQIKQEMIERQKRSREILSKRFPNLYPLAEPTQNQADKSAKP